MDADVRFKGRKIEHGSTLPLSNLSTHIILKNADLRLQPLKFGMAGGTISSNIHLEGDKKPMPMLNFTSFEAHIRIHHVPFVGFEAVIGQHFTRRLNVLFNLFRLTLPLSNLSTHIILKNADLRLQPLKFGMAGGTISSNIHLEGDKKPMQGRAEIQARRLKLKELMPDVELMQKTLGEMNGDADIRGTGNSVAALLGSGNGNLKLLMNDGLVSRNLMEILGLNAGNYIIGQILGQRSAR